jgi:dephospho-CoA kinase
MGKSTTAQMFKDAGIPVHDADAAVHRLYSAEAAPLIEKAFPGTTIDGVVNRKILGTRVIGDAKQMQKLEEIIHPLVDRERRKFLEAAKQDGAQLVVLDMPLMFETGSQKFCDKVLVVTAPMEVQKQRVLARPGMTFERFLSINGKQLPDAEKRARADFVLDTSMGMEAARQTVAGIIRELTGTANANS